MEHLTEQLSKCKTDKHIYSFLYKIRTKYANKEEDIERLLKHKWVGQLASLLGKRVELQPQTDENVKIIEVLLSILANCTYNNKTAALQIYDADIIDHVMTLINKSDNQVLIAKSCRLLGNLVHNEKIGLQFQQSGAALSLSNCLSEDNMQLLKTMSVRAIRLMWSSRKFRMEIMSFGTVFKIVLCLQGVLKREVKNVEEEEGKLSSDMVILKRDKEPDRLISKEKLSGILTKMEKHEVEIKYEIVRPEKKDPAQKFALPSSKDDQELISGILKLLLTMTATSSLGTQIAKSLYADGIAIPCLLFLIESSGKLRAQCLKILSNMTYTPNSSEFLGVNNELIPKISQLLTNEQLVANERKYCLDILCLSTENSCNRLKLKRSGAFKTLLSIASSTKVREELSLLIFAFFQYRYDEDSLTQLIQLNLINIFMKIIDDLLENLPVDHINNDDPKIDREELQPNRKRKAQTDLVSYTSQKYQRRESSPRNYIGSASPSSSGYGSYQYSPCSSSDGYSPYSCYQDYNSDSNEYSPVCSDAEEATEADKKKSNVFDIFEYMNDIGKEELQERESDDETDSKLSSRNQENVPDTLKLIDDDRLQYILLMLWKVSINHSDAAGFTANLPTLIKVFGIVKKPNEKIYQILQNIILQTRNFVPIFMKQDFVFDLFEASNQSYDHKDCYSCEKMKLVGIQLLKDFQKVAESGYAEGEIQHCLTQTANVELKRKIAIKITYVVASQEILNKFLFHYKALDVIMDTILRNEAYSVAACNGITILARNLNIQVAEDDKVLDRIIPDELVLRDDKEESSDFVTFKVKDGSVNFDKNTLRKASEVFDSMFSSDFRESERNEVEFPNYTVLGMKYFFNLIELANSEKLKCIAPKIDCMDAALQAYELSVLYILTKIQSPLLNVIKIILDETNVLKTFEWSIANVNQELLISTICFYLCGQVDGETKLKLYLEANESRYNKEWKHLICDSILMKCKPSDD